MAKVLLNVEKDGAVESTPVKIGRMKVKQLKGAMKKINEIITLVQTEESTSELISYFIDMEAPKEGENLGAELEDKIFMENILEAVKTLFGKLPDEMTELLAIVSGIDEDLIDNQEYDVLFEIAGAIIEENDIKGMIDNAKKTFFMARSKWGGFLPKSLA